MPDYPDSSIYAPYQLETELADRLNAMPKIELHVHLEGAVEAATVWEMSRRNGVPLPAASLAEWQTFFEFRDFSHFLEVYTASVYCIQTPQDFATDLNHEFHLLARQGFSWDELWQLNLNAIEASFLPEEEKEACRAEWASF